MRIGIERSVLVVLGLVAAAIGAWATLAPESFYLDFPGFGRHWVSADGPYNEHLVRDFGELNLALLVLTGAALLRPSARLTTTTGLAWLVYSAPHLVYHALHLDQFQALDRVLNACVLGANVALAVILLVGAVGRLQRHTR